MKNANSHLGTAKAEGIRRGKEMHARLEEIFIQLIAPSRV